MKLKTKVWTKNSALAEGKQAVVPSKETRWGKEEEAQLQLIFFSKCHKERKEGNLKEYCITCYVGQI